MEPLVTIEEAAETLGVTSNWLYKAKQRGDGPPFVMLGSRTLRYRPEDLRAWAEANRTDPNTSPSERAAADPQSAEDTAAAEGGAQ